MKTCSTCKQEKKLEDFNKNNRSDDGHQWRCRQCIKDWYALNNELHKANVKARNSKFKALAKDYVNSLKNAPCTDCGMFFIPFVMDFDHINNNKVKDICTMVGNGAGVIQIQEEIDKCELVCANCHRIRTWNRMQTE